MYREGMVAGMASRMDVQGEYSGLMSRMNNIFFKYNGLQWVTNRGKDGLASTVAGELGHQAAKSFDDLPDYFKKIIGTAGIDKRRWEIMRQGVFEASNGNKYMVGDMIRQLPDELFDVAGSTPTREKDDIITALNVLVSDFVESGVPTPGLKERGQLSAWQQPGTPMGALVKILTQFKSFPMTVWNKVLMPHIKDKKADGNMDRWGMALLAGNGILLGGAVLAAKDALKTREPEILNIDSPAGAAKYALQSLLQGGALGLYGDIIMQDYSRYGSTVGEQIAGPTVSSFSRLLREIVSKPMRGEGDVSSLLRAVEDNTPFLNYPGIRPAFDYMVMYSLQEYLNPGYLRRMERYAKNSGRPYIWSPSESVR
jgi:hypothetical protein